MVLEQQDGRDPTTLTNFKRSTLHDIKLWPKNESGALKIPYVIDNSSESLYWHSIYISDEFPIEILRPTE